MEIRILHLLCITPWARRTQLLQRAPLEVLFGAAAISKSVLPRFYVTPAAASWSKDNIYKLYVYKSMATATFE